jgi:hypothetical protein
MTERNENEEMKAARKAEAIQSGVWRSSENRKPASSVMAWLAAGNR